MTDTEFKERMKFPEFEAQITKGTRALCDGLLIFRCIGFSEDKIVNELVPSLLTEVITPALLEEEKSSKDSFFKRFLGRRM